MGRKRKGSSGPDRAIRIRTYDELESFITAFAAGHINLVIHVGAPGLAKSRTVRRAMPEACWIEGNPSPFGMYLKLYHERDSFVVIDDVDSLYGDRNGIRLLKCLCQTEEEKRVAWPSAARDLQREGVPREFVTKSRVVIITNEWKTLNHNVAALQGRGHTLVFEPVAAEVHRRVAEWFADEEIYGYIEERLQLISEPSMRLYLRALELKSAGMDWKQIVPTRPENARWRWPPSCSLTPRIQHRRRGLWNLPHVEPAAGQRTSIICGGFGNEDCNARRNL